MATKTKPKTTKSKNEPPPKWAVRLKNAFVASGFKNQTALGKTLGVSQQAVSSWFKGTRQPDIEMFERLSVVLRVRPEWLAFGVGWQDDDDANTPHSIAKPVKAPLSKIDSNRLRR